MTNGGTTQERDADERQAEGSKNNDEGGQVRKGAQVGSRASQSVADPLSLSLSLTSSRTVFGGRTPIFPSRDSGSRHVFSPLLQFSSGSDRSAVQYLQMEAAKEEKSSFASRSPAPPPSERNTFLWCGRRSRLGRRAGGRWPMMGSVEPLELIARGGFSPE